MNVEKKTRFKELREKQNLRQDELAKHLNTTRDIIVRTENEKVKGYDKELLKNYSDYFNVSFEYLLGYSDLETKSEDIKMISKYTGLDEEALKIIDAKMNEPIPENERWIETLNAVIHNPNILYAISDIISSKRISGVLEVSKTPDEEGLNSTNPILDFNDDNEYKLFSYSANGSMLQHTITDELLEAAYWKELEALIDSLKEKRKDGDTNAKESTLQSKRNRQRDNAKRSQA